MLQPKKNINTVSLAGLQDTTDRNQRFITQQK